MDTAKAITFGILLIIWIFVVIKVYFSSKAEKSYHNTTKFMTRVAIFGAISTLLYIFIKFPVPFLPSFLEFHFDEIPIFIAGFAYGPLSAFCVILVKTIIKLPMTSTLGVGELSDFIYSCAFVLPAAFIYRKHRTFKSAMIGLGVGTVFQLVFALIGNIYVMIPFYMEVMQFPKAAILGLMQKANPNITDIGWTYGLLAVLPFNAIKDAAVLVLTIITYKSVHRFIDKMQK